MNLLIIIQFLLINYVFCDECEQYESSAQDKIINGHHAESDEFPYVVSIQCRFRKEKTWHLCHGILIHKKLVITYSVCGGVSIWIMEREGLCGIMFNHDNKLKFKGGKYEDIERIYRHGAVYDKEPHDLSLIRLKRPIQDAKYTPIKIGQASPVVGMKVYMATWGKSGSLLKGPKHVDHLRRKAMTIVPFKNCAPKGLPEGFPKFTEKNYFCTDLATCHNHLTSPIVVKGDKPELDYLIGYVGHQHHPNCTGYNGINSRVLYYIDWIKYILKNHGDTLP